MRWHRRLALGLWVAALAATGAFVAAIIALWGRLDGGFDDALPIAALFVALFCGHATAGLLIARREPRNAVGWLLLATGIAGGLGFALEQYSYAALRAWPGQLPAGELAAVLYTPLMVGGLFGLPGMVLLLFPTGTPLSSRWRWAVRVIVVVAAAGLAAGPFASRGEFAGQEIPNPIAAPGLLGEIAAVLGGLLPPLAGLTALLGGISMVLRYRRSTGAERLQLKWFSLVAGAAGALLGSWIALEMVFTPATRPLAMEALFLSGLVALVLFPVVIAMAVLRYRLYDIDLIISRTVSYAAVSGVLVVVYAAGVVTLGQLLSPVTRDSEVAVAASTLLVAALFQPVRRRVQVLVDRRFNRAGYDAQRSVEAFSAQLRQQVGLEDVSTELVATVEATLQPASMTLWLRPVAEPQR